MPSKPTTLAITVAVAAPAMPSCGAGPSPRMKTGLSEISSPTASSMNQSGVSASPLPRSAIISTTDISPDGIERKITRR